MMLRCGEIHVALLWVVAGLRLRNEKAKKTHEMHDTCEENDQKAENALSSVK